MTTLAVREPETIDLVAIRAELDPMTDEQIKARFLQCYAGAARYIAEGALCIKVLRERGATISGVQHVGWWLSIAEGKVLPELAWKFIESKGRRLVERLPLDDQRRLVDNPAVPIVEAKPGGGYTTRMVNLADASQEVVKMAAGPDGIRSPEEQLAYLGQQRARATATPAKRSAPMERRDRRLALMLTTPEMSALMDNAASEGLSDHDYALRVLTRAGAFKRAKT